MLLVRMILAWVVFRVSFLSGGHCCFGANFCVFGFTDVEHLLFRVYLSGRQVYCVGIFDHVSCFVYYRVQHGSILDSLRRRFSSSVHNYSLFELGARCTDWRPSREIGVVFPLSSRQ
jgi:hypothetical protein